MQLQFHIYTIVEISLSKQFIIQWISPPMMQNFSQLDMESIQPFKFQMLNKLSSLQMLFQLQDVFLICLTIPFNYILLQYLKILEPSLIRTLITQFYFRIFLVVINSLPIWQSTRRLNILRQILYSYVNLHGILAKKKNVMQF